MDCSFKLVNAFLLIISLRKLQKLRSASYLQRGCSELWATA